MSGFLLLLRLAYFRLSFSLSSTQQIKPGGEQVGGETKERRRRRRETTTARRREEAMGIVLLLLLLVGCGLGFSSFLGFFFFWVLRQNQTDSSLREEKWEWEGGRGGEERERKRGRRDGRHGDKRGRKEGGREGGTAVSPRRRVRHKQARATQIVCVAGCLPTLADKEANRKKPRLTRKNTHASNERKENPQHYPKTQIIIRSSILSHSFAPSSIHFIIHLLTRPFIFSSV